MGQSCVQSNEDGQRFVWRILHKEIPVILYIWLSIYTSHLVQVLLLLWWSYTNTYIGASLWVLQKEEVNTTNKVALVLPTEPHSTKHIWLLYISFYLNFDMVLYNTACRYYLKTYYKLSTFKLKTYLQGLLIICRLHIHLYLCVWITEVHRARGFLKDQEQGRKSTWGSEIDHIWVICLWLYQIISQPALPESNSGLPKLPHEEENKGRESWPLTYGWF